MNKVFLSGIVSEAPAMITDRRGEVHTMLQLCVTHSTRGGERKRELYPVNAWGKTAEWAYRYLDQGQRISLQGYLTQYKADGDAYPLRVEVTANEFFAESLGKSNPAGASLSPEPGPVKTEAGREKHSDCRGDSRHSPGGRAGTGCFRKECDGPQRLAKG